MTENSVDTEDTFAPDVSTTRNDALHRYELHVGGKLAVQVRYIDRPGHVDFIHTETAEEFAGQGLAGVLAHFALDDVVASGKRIIPHCPYIYRYLRKHDAYNQCIDWPEQEPAGA
ncbi:N-acetyltransferase [Arthrobacter sp. UKPF54-2]|uniref:GNAT family N-acetyltransferase n=1 Tax=Arthrobacter sp. UKPF54-2 TaxID=2600159 RepID=UPI0011B18ABA|nr:GNAT family N-acetyltransferase [Arthrobacter sp. UKPF54-2]QDY89533.1 N-acetyltransferase [Arthrobacter sp. UKPF54-2]